MELPTPAQLRAFSAVLAARLPEDGGANDEFLEAASGVESPLVGRMTDRRVGDSEEPGERMPGCKVPSWMEPMVRKAIALRIERNVIQGQRVKKREATVEGARLNSFSAGPYCVPMDSEALTDRGWRSYGDLCVGDMVLGYDLLEHVARWTPIRELIAPTDAETVRIGNRRWSLRCTPEHRWLVRDRSIDHYVTGEWGEWELRAAADLTGRNFDIRLVAPARTPHDLDITPAEAALIAWLWTDGHVEQRAAHETHKAHIRGTIYQKHYRAAVEDILDTTGAPHTVVLDARDEEYARYRLRSPWLRDLWLRAELDVLSPVEFVLRLGDEAREAFLEAGLLAEGSMPRSSRRPERAPMGRWYRWHFAQNEGPVLDAFVLAAHLCGYGARVWRSLSRCKGFLLGRSYHSGQSVRVVPHGRELTWCVRTDLGSWTMRQGNVMALTGNSESYQPMSAELQGHVLDPDREIHDLLWEICTEDKRGWWRAYWGGYNVPAGAPQAVPWTYPARIRQGY